MRELSFQVMNNVRIRVSYTAERLLLQSFMQARPGNEPSARPVVVPCPILFVAGERKVITKGV